MAVHPGTGELLAAGFTESLDFPKVNPSQPGPGGGRDVFVTRFSVAGNALVYSTLLGGGGDDQGWGIAVDGSGNVFVGGATGSDNFPTAKPLQPVKRGGGADAFVTRIAECGVSLILTATGGNGVLNVTTGIGTEGAAQGTWVLGILVFPQGSPSFFGATLYSGPLPLIEPPFHTSLQLNIGHHEAVGVLTAFFNPDGTLCTYRLVWTSTAAPAAFDVEPSGQTRPHVLKQLGQILKDLTYDQFRKVFAGTP